MGMIRRKINGNESGWTGLMILFLTAVIIRSILVFILRNGPTVIIDESLYTNIARSLFYDGKLEYRAQPINYPYLFYPITLLPVYALQHLLGGDIYRYIQIFNIILMSSACIPAFLFARHFTGNPKKALGVAGFTLLMPDMVMSGFMMSESVIWPLAFWLIYCSYQMLITARTKYTCLTALFTFLMYFTKPGAIVMGLVILCFVGVVRFVSKQNRGQVFLGFGVLAFLTVLMYVLYGCLSASGFSLIGLYTKQTSEWQATDALVAAEAVPIMLFTFVAACGGICTILPLATLKRYSKENRLFIIAVCAGGLGVIIGTAIFVVPYKWNSTLGNIPVHLRYCSMFVPVFITFAAAADLTALKSNRLLRIALIIFAIMMILPGIRIGFVRGFSGSIDSMSLAAFFTTAHFNGQTVGWILTCVTVIYVLYVILRARKGGLSNSIIKCTTIYMTVFFLFNNVAAYKQSDIYLDNDKKLSHSVIEDAKEVNQILDSTESALCVTQRYYDDIYSYWLESRLTKPLQHVTIDQMYVSMNETGGIYHPFVPLDQAPNIGSHETVDTTTFVLGKTIAEHMEISDTANLYTTANGQFSIVQFEDGTRWVDTMMYGMDDNRLSSGSTGSILVFDESRNIDGYITLRIRAYGDGELTVGDSTIQLSRKVQTYIIKTTYTKTIPVKAVGANAYILSYTTDHE